MKVLGLSYFNKFKCIGSECSRSCCEGWKISIDKATMKKYRSIDKKNGREDVLNKINVKRERNISSYSMKLDENKKCGFLNENKLCDIYGKYGEDYMSNTCKSFPRNIRTINNTVSIDLSIACIEATRLILTEDEISIYEFEQDLPYYQKEVDRFNSTFEKDNKFLLELFYSDKFNINKKIFLGFIYDSLNEEEKIEFKEQLVEDNEYFGIKEASSAKLISSMNLLVNSCKAIRVSSPYSMQCINTLSKYIGDVTDESLGEFEDELEKFNKNIRNYFVNSIYYKKVGVKNYQEEYKIAVLEYLIVKLFIFALYMDNSSVLTEDIIIDAVNSFGIGMKSSPKLKDELSKTANKLTSSEILVLI
ncbi:MAG: flagellin lysine-N-methylase [Peptostreptococcaceae bacterium]